MYRWLIVVPTIAFLAYGFTNPASVELFRPDSPQYVNFDPVRSAGYPVFLDLGVALMGSLELVPYLQLVLFALAALYLSREIQLSTGSTLLATGLGLAFLIHPRIYGLTFQIITEPVFIATLMVALGLLMRLLRLPNLWAFAAFSAVVGIAATIKPAALSFFPILILVWLLSWVALERRRIAALAIVVLPALLTLLAERAFYQSVHGPERMSLTGVHAFAKAGMVNTDHQWSEQDLERLTPTERALFDSLGADLQPMRDLIWSTDHFGLKRNLTSSYEIFLQYFYRPDLRERLIEEKQGDLVAVYDSLGRIGLQRLERSVLGYVRLTLVNYRALWSGMVLQTPWGHRAKVQFLAESRPIPFDGTVRGVDFVRPANLMAIPVSLAIPAIGVATLIAIAFAVFQWMRHRKLHYALAVSALVGALIHLNFGVTAAFGVSNARYTVAMWPAAIVSMTFLLMYMWDIFRKRSRPQIL
ncbi:MAG: hypothetical protein ACE363_16235 [Alphaproteobacteria bacterium]